MDKASQESTLARLLEATSGVTGDAFFDALARGITELFGVRHALVSRYVGERDEIEVLSWRDEGRHRDTTCYELAGTPCAEVLQQSSFMAARDVWRAFPEDTLLREEGIEAYFGRTLVDEHGATRGMLTVMHDAPVEDFGPIEAVFDVFAERAAAVIARAAAMEGLRQREARLSSILEAMSEGVWEIDADNRTTFVNARMEEILRQPRGAMLGRSMFDFLPDGARERASDNVDRRRRGIAEHHDSPLRCSDGEIVWTTMATKPMLDQEGRYRGALAIVTDVTHARAVERRLAEAHKLEGLELLAAGVAHDFNNVLGVILAHAQLAARRVTRSADVAVSLTHIEDAVGRGMRLTRRLRAYAGAATGEHERVDVTALVEGIAKVLAPTLPSGVALEPHVSDDLELVGDRSALEQALLNLITNARDALAQSGGRVRVEAAMRDVAASTLERSRIPHEVAAGERLVIEVSDDGPGMERSIADRVFDPFFTTRGAERGLGLAIVRGVAKAHGAALVLDTAAGEGARFLLVFPRSSDEAAAAARPSVPPPGAEAPDAAASPSAAGLRILLVDDDEALRLGVEACLRDLGHEVDVAASGTAALGRVSEAERPYSLLLVDLHMPDGDGLWALQTLRGRGVTVPAVLVSGAPSAEAAAFVAQDPATVLATKPIGAAELLLLATSRFE